MKYPCRFIDESRKIESNDAECANGEEETTLHVGLEPPTRNRQKKDASVSPLLLQTLLHSGPFRSRTKPDESEKTYTYFIGSFFLSSMTDSYSTCGGKKEERGKATRLHERERKSEFKANEKNEKMRCAVFFSSFISLSLSPREKKLCF